MSFLEKIKGGIYSGIGFILVIFITGITYGAYVTLINITSGQSLSSVLFNSVLENQRVLKAVQDSILSGTAGVTGPTGATGSIGPRGIQGLTGTAGLDGANGINGTNGTQGIQGIQGIRGLTGSPGSTTGVVTGGSYSWSSGGSWRYATWGASTNSYCTSGIKRTIGAKSFLCIR